MSAGTLPVVARLTNKISRFYNIWINTMYFIAHYWHQDFYKLIITSHFCAIPNLLCFCPFSVFHLPAALVLMLLFSPPLQISSSPYLLSYFPFPGVHGVHLLPDLAWVPPRSKQSRQQCFLHENQVRTVLLPCPPASATKLLPPAQPLFRPKRQWDKGNKVF